MMRLGSMGIICCTLLAASASLWAGRLLDDSASPLQQVRAEAQWTSSSAGTLSGTSASQAKWALMTAVVHNLDIRLDTSEYVGEVARIYMRIPLPVQGLKTANAMRVNWLSDGTLQDGSLVPGSRALVFHGKIESAQLRAVLDMEIRLDGRAVTGVIRFEPVFEIEME